MNLAREEECAWTNRKHMFVNCFIQYWDMQRKSERQNVQKLVLSKNAAFMDTERWKSKSQMESTQACCQDAAWASYSLRAREPGTEGKSWAGQGRAFPNRAQSSVPGPGEPGTPKCRGQVQPRVEVSGLSVSRRADRCHNRSIPSVFSFLDDF